MKIAMNFELPRFFKKNRNFIGKYNLIRWKFKFERNVSLYFKNNSHIEECNNSLKIRKRKFSFHYQANKFLFIPIPSIESRRKSKVFVFKVFVRMQNIARRDFVCDKKGIVTVTRRVSVSLIKIIALSPSTSCTNLFNEHYQHCPPLFRAYHPSLDLALLTFINISKFKQLLPLLWINILTTKVITPLESWNNTREAKN